MPLPTIAAPAGAPDGMLDYVKPLDADLHLRDFASPALRAIVDEVSLQAHLLVLSFGMAVEDRLGVEAAVDACARQFTGVAGVVAERLRRAFGLGAGPDGLATVFSLHPAFHPRSYVRWDVAVDGETVRLELGDCPAREETGFESWITLLADGHDRALSAIAMGVDACWVVRPDGPTRWVAERGTEPADDLSEVVLTKFSTGVAFGFDR